MEGLLEVTNVFRMMVPSVTPYDLLFPRLGLTTPNQNSDHYYLRNC